VALRRRELVQVAKDRPQQVVQPGERQKCLRLHPRNVQHQHPAIRRAHRGLTKERRLAHARPAGHLQGTAPGVNVIEQPVQHV